MKREQVLFLMVLVLAYYYWQYKKSWKSVSLSTVSGMPRRVQTSSGTSTVGSGASTTPSSSLLTTPFTNAQMGSGRGWFSAPATPIQALNAPSTSQNLGTRRATRTLSKGRSGFMTGGISATFPTTQVLPTKSVRIQSGRVQVPSYTTVPVVTRAAGGAGSIINGRAF